MKQKNIIAEFCKSTSMNNMVESITVEIIVNLPVEQVWKIWTTPADIMQWNNPSSDWHSPKVENDMRAEGEFLFRMERKDGSTGFNHSGIYDIVIPNKLIEYTVADGRKSKIVFQSGQNSTTIIETFEPEKQMPHDMQRDFCKSVLENFKKYAEGVD